MIVVLACVVFVGADLAAQFVIEGHTANPLIDGPLVALIGSILIGAKGPKPDPEEPAEPEDPTTSSGRHRGGDTS